MTTDTTKKPLEVSRLNLNLEVPAFPVLEGKPYTVANISLRCEPTEDRKHKDYCWDFTVTVELKCALHDGKMVKCDWDKPCCPQGVNFKFSLNDHTVRSHSDADTTWHTAHVLTVPYAKPSLMPRMPPSEGSSLPDMLLWQDVKARAQRTAVALVAALVEERDTRDAQEAAEKLLRRAEHIAERLRNVASKRAKKACDYDARLTALREDLATYRGQATASVLAEVAAEGINDTEGERAPQDVVDLAVSLVKAQPRSTAGMAWNDDD